jgi:hemerythrin
MAGKIEWKEEYSVGVKLIDDQHKVFVGILNELYESSASDKVKESLTHIMDELVSYAGYHFATEEKYFDEFHYEGKEEHVGLHKNLAAKVYQFKKRMEGGENNQEIIWELVDFLEDWLVDHLNTADKKYTKCFNEHGLR